jgi:hypothetical protein
MKPTLIGFIAFAFAFGGVMLGNWLRTVLPEHHLHDESRDVIKLGTGMIATMSVLVLGLVTASAKSSFDAFDRAVKDTAMQLLALDRGLARYGPDTQEIRKGLKEALSERIDAVWPSDSSKVASLDPTTAEATRFEALADAIRSLKPRDDLQRALQARTVELAEGLLQTRWLVVAGTEASVPTVFLVILFFWLTEIFTTFGMFAPNRSAIAILFVSALSIGGALFLIIEMDGPLDGVLRVSPDPLRFAYTHINR